MSKRIDLDAQRFKQIVKGQVRKNLREFVSSSNIKIQRDGKTLSLPLHEIDIPKLRFDDKKAGGLSMGDGDVGDAVFDENSDKQAGAGKQAGSDIGEHGYSTEIEIDEFLDILSQELKLPNLQPKSSGEQITSESRRYSSVNKVGPQGLKIFRRTYKKALLRSIVSGIYSKEQPIVIPRREDAYYKFPKEIVKPDVKAVIFYMMDVSGSIAHDIKEIIQTTCFWIDAFLQKTYKDKLETRYIIHDTQAKEIEREKFYRITTNGGTQISSALNLVRKIIKKEYNPKEWNVYLALFGDGENISIDDNGVCISAIRDLTARLNVNQFSYCEINDRRNKYDTLFTTMQKYKSILLPNVRSIQIQDKDQIIDVINELFH